METPQDFAGRRAPVTGAAALWLPPGVHSDEAALDTAVRSGTDPDPLDDMLSVFEKMDQAHPDEPFWHLAVIGVEPNAQGRGPGQRHFCGLCGSPLWLWDPRWPELVHPLASAIDTPLPLPPERTHLLLDSKAPWVSVRADPQDRLHERFRDESIAEWHERLGLVDGS